MEEKDEILTCIVCGEEKEDVCWRINPYTYDLYDDNNTYPICGDCTYELAMDV